VFHGRRRLVQLMPEIVTSSTKRESGGNNPLRLAAQSAPCRHSGRATVASRCATGTWVQNNGIVAQNRNEFPNMHPEKRSNLRSGSKGGPAAPHRSGTSAAEGPEARAAKGPGGPSRAAPAQSGG
jgi:hypothetical protein